MRKLIDFITLGCSKNLVDSEWLMGLFEQRGFHCTHDAKRPQADIVARHKKGVFIFELKVGEPVDRAFAQLRGKGYADPYVASGKPVWLIGLSFNPDTRKLVDCAAEKFSAECQQTS